MITARALAAATGSTIALAERYAPHLAEAMFAYGIDTPMRQAMFLPNLGHESLRLSRTVENLNYKAVALVAKFGRHRISLTDANRYGRIDEKKQVANQEAIANCLYGGTFGLKMLGNTQPGDGWKFRGRGLIMTTGRYNARVLRDRLRKRFPGLAVPDFEASPEQIATDRWAAFSAADYADMKGLNAIADRGDFDAYADTVNLGSETDKYGDSFGWEERLALFNSAKVALRA